MGSARERSGWATDRLGMAARIRMGSSHARAISALGRLRHQLDGRMCGSTLWVCGDGADRYWPGPLATDHQDPSSCWQRRHEHLPQPDVEQPQLFVRVDGEQRRGRQPGPAIGPATTHSEPTRARGESLVRSASKSRIVGSGSHLPVDLEQLAVLRMRSRDETSLPLRRPMRPSRRRSAMPSRIGKAERTSYERRLR